MHSSQSRAATCPLPLTSGRGSRASWHRGHLFTSGVYAVGRGPAGRVPAQSGDSHPPLPELPLPMAGIAHQLTGLTGKEQKWMRARRGWLHAKAGFSLASRRVCVDITKGSSPIPSQPCHGAYLRLKYMRLVLLSGNTIKNILFSSGVLEDMCMCV